MNIGALCLALHLAGAPALWTSLPSVPAVQQADRKGSPFDGLRWVGERPQVLVEGEWYEPQSIAGVPVGEILAFCEERWPGQLRKRFAEDLVEAIHLMGHEVPERVDLELSRLARDEVVELQGVSVTRAKREALRRAGAVPAVLTREAALQDLDELERRLTDQFAYLNLGDFDWRAVLARIRKELAPEVRSADFAVHLEHLMAGFRDGHAGVTSPYLPRPRAYPPFLLEDAMGGVVAFLSDRSGFVDPEHPFVVTIDGIGVDDWIERVTPAITAGSAQLVRRRALRGLRDLELLRRTGDAFVPGRVTLELAAANGSEPVERELAMTPKRPIYGPWPRRATGMLEGNVGYLRLARMDDERVPDLRKAMESFRGAKGLIVDVRGNGGGSRSLLLALAGYLIAPEEGPWVANVAKYISSESFGTDHLEARFMYRADDERWSASQRVAIEAAAAAFEPEWNPPGDFSEWHYLVLDRTGHADEYFFQGPVVILSDSVCFSATDIFLGALSGRPRITSMGGASGGGSARSQRFRLGASGVTVSCASMASFRPDGRLYDGRGIEVDIELVPQPEDFLVDGIDRVLDAALARIRSKVR